MAKTISELRNQSIQVRDASAAGENTATRVGTVLNDIVGHIEDYENTQSSNNSSQDAKIEGIKSSLNAEIARAKTEESNLSTQIGTERTERQAAVSREETARIQADNDEKTARQQADNAEQDARIKADNDEKTARENADITLRTMIQTEVSNRQIAVKQEEIRAMVAEKANTQAIEDENARAMAEEERLQREIDNTNTNVETLDDKVNSNHDHLTNEVARLDLADNEIKADLETETTRAKAAEEANVQAIADEVARAKAAEQANVQAIADEVARAKAAEQAIIYDVSAYNNGAVFESLSALLSNSNLDTLIPVSFRHGGMIIRFIQGSEQTSDNKYVQYRLMSNVWSTTVTNWQGVDDEPTVGSDNLVKSGGVANKLTELETKTSEISKGVVGTEEESIDIEDNDGNKVLHIDSNGVNAKNLKNNGKEVLTEHQVSGLATKDEVEKKQDIIPQIEQSQNYKKNENSITVLDNDNKQILNITPNGIGANSYNDLQGNLIADDYLFKNGILYYGGLNISWVNPCNQWKEYYTYHLVQSYPLKCIAGHKYTIDFNKANSNIHGVQVDFGTSVDSFTDSLSGDLPTSKYMNTGVGDIAFVAPKSAKYFRLHFIAKDKDTPLSNSDVDNNGVILADVSTKSITETAQLIYPLQYVKAIDNDHYCQGMAMQNGCIFLAFADGTIDVIDFKTREKLDTFTVAVPSTETVPYLHLNNMCFGKKYDDEDEFGVLFITSASLTGSIVGLRITRVGNNFSAVNIYEIPVPQVPNTQEGLCEYFDFANNRLVCLSINKGTSIANPKWGDYKFYVFKYEGDLNNNTTFTLDYYWNFPQVYPGQGSIVVDNMLYFCAGTAVHCSRIYVFNVISGILEKVYDLRGERYGIGADEIQDICLYDGDLYVNFVHGIYRINN